MTKQKEKEVEKKKMQRPEWHNKMLKRTEENKVDKYFVEIQTNGNFHGKKKGDVFRVEVDKHGIPLDGMWRRRFLDAPKDKNVTIFPEKKEVKKEDEKKKPIVEVTKQAASDKTPANAPSTEGRR